MQIQPADNWAISGAQERRARELRRAFQRELNHKPTTLQRTPIDRAAVMTARAELACSDPFPEAAHWLGCRPWREIERAFDRGWKLLHETVAPPR